tara:strand:- start:676 stop:1212 length:537 start_codon:yes stop_codon:yes gene_type:complete
VKKYIIIFIVLTLSVLFGQGQKIGYVDMQAIFANNDDARLAMADVEKESKRLQVELENKAMTLDSLMRDYQKFELMWSDDMKLEKQKQIEGLNREVEEFQVKYFSQPNGEIYNMYAARMAPIEQLVKRSIDMIAAENGYDYVLDVSQGIVLYTLDAYDLTNLVIEKVNKMSINQDVEE